MKALIIIPTEKVGEHERNIDPRAASVKYRGSSRIAFAKEDINLTLPKFMIDEYYVGVPPDVQVSINNLNDNADAAFLRRELDKFGTISICDVLHHPITKAHLGLAKVQFEKVTSAKECVSKCHDKRIMGKKVSVFLDPRYTKINAIRESIINPPAPQTIPAHQALIPPVLPNLQFPSLIQQTTNGIGCKSPQRGSLEDRINFLLKQPNSGLAQSLLPSYNEPHQFLPDINKLALCRTPSPIESVQFTTYNEFRKDTYNRNDRNNYNNSRNSCRDRDRERDRDRDRDRGRDRDNGYHHNHRRRSQPPSPIRQHSSESQQEKKVVQRKIPNNLSREDIENWMEDFVRIYEDWFKNFVFKIIHKAIIEKEGFPMIDKEQTTYKESHSNKKSDEQKRYDTNIRNVLGTTYGNNLPNNRSTLISRSLRKESNPIATARRNQVDENTLKRKNRSSGWIETQTRPETRKGASNKDVQNFKKSPTSISSSSSSSSDSSSDSESDSDSDSSSDDASDLDSSSSSSISTTQKTRQDSISPHISTPILKDSQTEARSISRDERENSMEETEVAQILADLSVAPSTEAFFPTDLEDTINQKAESIDIDEDPIIKTTKKRKVIGELSFGTERQLKRLKPDLDDLDKLREIPEPTFDARTEEEKNKIIDDIYGIDEEAFDYLVQAYREMCVDPEFSSLLQGSKPGSEATNRSHLPFSSKKKKKEVGHPSWWKGCSRCDGFPREKEETKSTKNTTWKGDDTDQNDLSKAPIKSRAQVKGSSRSDLRGEQRRFAVAHAETLGSAVSKFMSSSLQMRSKNLRFSLSKIHKWGLFACEKIASGAAVIEYVGEKIRPSLADHREKVYANSNTHDGSSYFFRVDDQVIDATLKGNKARFINHSCNPNCIAKVIRHDNGTGNAIVIYASRTIEEEEEITYDYKFPREDIPLEQKIHCNCRASNCQKYLN